MKPLNTRSSCSRRQMLPISAVLGHLIISCCDSYHGGSIEVYWQSVLEWRQLWSNMLTLVSDLYTLALLPIWWLFDFVRCFPLDLTIFMCNPSLSFHRKQIFYHTIYSDYCFLSTNSSQIISTPQLIQIYTLYLSLARKQIGILIINEDNNNQTKEEKEPYLLVHASPRELIITVYVNLYQIFRNMCTAI